MGDYRIQFDRGPAGHNGIKSIVENLGTQQFHRLRIGIGKPTHKSDVAKYVLSDFSVCQREHLPEIIQHVKKSIKALLTSDLKEVSLQYTLKQTLCDGDKV